MPCIIQTFDRVLRMESYPFQVLIALFGGLHLDRQIKEIQPVMGSFGLGLREPHFTSRLLQIPKKAD